MARLTRPADVAAQAARILPTLDKLDQRLGNNPGAVVDLAFPEADPGFHPPGAEEGEEVPEKIGPPTVAPAVRRHRERLVRAAHDAIRKVKEDGPDAALSAEEAEGLEAIVLVVGRPAILFKGGRFLPPPPPWDEELNAARGKIEAAARSVGRIELYGQPGVPYLGTGFVVAEGVVMTNRHVARLFSQQGGRGAWVFKEGLSAGVDYTDAPEDGKPAAFKVEAVLGVHDRFDLALLKLGKGAAKRAKLPPALPVAGETPASLKERKVYVVGYPARDPRNGEAAMRNIFGDVYNVKRLQPGKVLSFAKADGTFKHDSSTLGGNSGSCVLDLETHRVLGLHFGGLYLKYNQAVALWGLTKDKLLKATKVNFI
jgi:hypothetical protein